MWARTLQPTVVCAALVGLVIFGIACGNGAHGVTADTSTSRVARGDGGQGTSTSSLRSSVTWTTSSTLPTATEPQPCGEVTAPEGPVVRIFVVQGEASCPDAETLIGDYFDGRPDLSEDPEQRLLVDGWECVTDHEVGGGPVSTCTLPGFGVVGAAPDPS